MPGIWALQTPQTAIWYSTILERFRLSQPSPLGTRAWRHRSGCSGPSTLVGYQGPNRPFVRAEPLLCRSIYRIAADRSMRRTGQPGGDSRASGAPAARDQRRPARRPSYRGAGHGHSHKGPRGTVRACGTGAGSFRVRHRAPRRGSPVPFAANLDAVSVTALWHPY